MFEPVNLYHVIFDRKVSVLQLCFQCAQNIIEETVEQLSYDICSYLISF